MSWIYIVRRLLLPVVLGFVFCSSSCSAVSPHDTSRDDATLEGLVSELDLRAGILSLEACGQTFRLSIDPDRDFGFDLQHLRDHIDSKEGVIVRLDSNGMVAEIHDLADSPMCPR